jgi:hypothetical protein
MHQAPGRLVNRLNLDHRPAAGLVASSCADVDQAGVTSLPKASWKSTGGSTAPASALTASPNSGDICGARTARRAVEANLPVPNWWARPLHVRQLYNRTEPS